MTEQDNKVINEALSSIRDIYATAPERDEAARSIFKLLQERDEDPDIAECQNAIGKTGALEELWVMYKNKTGSEYVTLCLTWALFRNRLNSDILGKRADFGPTIQAVILDDRSGATKRAHAMDLWDNVVNNLSTFDDSILDIIPCVVNLMATTTSIKTKGRCVNSARISSYREAPRERLRRTNILDLLLDVIGYQYQGAGKDALAPHAACQVVANLVGHIPNHPALSAASISCVGNLVTCFARALENQDYPLHSNTFPNDYFVCMGVANLANSDSMKTLLMNKKIFTHLGAALKRAQAKNHADRIRLKVEAYKCFARICTVPEYARALKSKAHKETWDHITSDARVAPQQSVKQLANEIASLVKIGQEEPLKETAVRETLQDTVKVRGKDGIVICEAQMMGKDLSQTVVGLEKEGFYVFEHPLVNVPRTQRKGFFSYLKDRGAEMIGQLPSVEHEAPTATRRLPDGSIAVLAVSNKKPCSKLDSILPANWSPHKATRARVSRVASFFSGKRKRRCEALIEDIEKMDVDNPSQVVHLKADFTGLGQLCRRAGNLDEVLDSSLCHLASPPRRKRSRLNAQKRPPAAPPTFLPSRAPIAQTKPAPSFLNHPDSSPAPPEDPAAPLSNGEAFKNWDPSAEELKENDDEPAKKMDRLVLDSDVCGINTTCPGGGVVAATSEQLVYKPPRAAACQTSSGLRTRIGDFFQTLREQRAMEQNRKSS